MLYLWRLCRKLLHPLHTAQSRCLHLAAAVSAESCTLPHLRSAAYVCTLCRPYLATTTLQGLCSAEGRASKASCFCRSIQQGGYSQTSQTRWPGRLARPHWPDTKWQVKRELLHTQILPCKQRRKFLSSTATYLSIFSYACRPRQTSRINRTLNRQALTSHANLVAWVTCSAP